jgi:Amt family ammonium transporter
LATPIDINLINNLWVLVAGVLVFTMTISVGLLELGELSEGYARSLAKSMLIVGSAFFFMSFLGFDTAFAPTIAGIIGNPIYNGLFLGGFDPNATGVLTGIWWSMGSAYFSTGLTVGTYFLFETAFASVTLALVSVVVLKKVRLDSFMLYSIAYFIIIWNLPAAWIWNPTGWLYLLGVRDFAGGLVVHGAAGAAGLAFLHRTWREEKKMGFKKSVEIPVKVDPGWLTVSISLLWLGWFGFNPGSVLAFNSSAMTVVLTTFLAASSAMLSTMVVRYSETENLGERTDIANGILMGLIVITPVAGFVSPAGAVILGLIAGPLYIFASSQAEKFKWFTDPVGLLPGHMVGGVFGLLMIAFFTQKEYAAASGNATLPNGLFFGGGLSALYQLGLEIFAAIVVIITVFVLSWIVLEIIALITHGITTDYRKMGLIKEHTTASSSR